MTLKGCKWMLQCRNSRMFSVCVVKCAISFSPPSSTVRIFSDSSSVKQTCVMSLMTPLDTLRNIRNM
ncbi:Uncharacterized protein APZ42_027549 [Daphnia magna]|uniref:Uncharacterized protein n=1 Tax=Daphnia magna TaxID=35525 RepID=A0A164R9A2_9CRUS|nr:Uncharacterized protein APZ42_027549 [Daphnia magna]